MNEAINGESARRRHRGAAFGAVAVAAVLAFAGTACSSSSKTSTSTPATSAGSSGATSTTGGSAQAKATFKFKALDAGGPLTTGALKNGTIQIGEFFSVNSTPDDNGWVTLADDKHLQAADNFAPAIRQAKNTPEIAAVLDAVNAKLTQSAMKQMVADVSNKGQNPGDVAKKWLQDNNLPGTLKATGSLTVGSANFAESEVAAHLYGTALGDAGVKVSYKDDVGSRQVYWPALTKGDIDLVPEFTASLLLFLDPNATASSDLQTTYNAVKQAAAKDGVVILTPANVNDVNVFVVTKDTASKYHLAKLSDLTGVTTPLTLGGPPECTKNAQCIPGLERVYGLKFAVS